MAGLMQSGGFGWQAGSQIAGGIAARRGADFEAQQDTVNAGQQVAASQRAAESQDLNGRLLASRAQAVAAASGGGATDPTVTGIIQRIAGQTAYRSALALYQGNDAARALLTRADAVRFGGREAQAAGIVNALGTTLKGAYTMYDKYNKGSPVTSNTPIDWNLESGIS